MLKDDLSAEADAEVLEIMQELKRHSRAETFLHHFLYFARRSEAKRAAKELHRSGFVVDVSRLGLGGRRWSVMATHTAVVSASSIRLMRKGMERVADTFSGKYDGWEVEIRTDDWPDCGCPPAW